jgi:2-polyprenyl-3-methyl-5-hydroxy-6-metoxy-1,4-benzoquinol methylase
LNKNSCILCGSQHISKIDHIPKNLLNKAYVKEYGIDVLDDIKEDMHLIHCHVCDIKFFDPCQTGGQSFYTSLQKFEWYYKSDKYEYEYVSSKLIKTNDNVLEIGCGTGTFSNRIRSSNYVGLEFSENAVRLGRWYGRNIKQQSIEDHAKENENQYDVVCSFQVLEHTSDPKSFIESCIKVLKPGGTLIITTPSEDSWIQYKQDFCLNMPPHHVTKWTDKCLINISKLFGVKHVDIHHEPLDFFHISWYFNSLFVFQLNSLLKIKHSLLKRKRHWIPHFIANALSKVFGRTLPDAFKPHGHTVISVYKK